MDNIELGQTGLNISPIGLGTVKFGRNEGVKYPQGLIFRLRIHSLIF